MDRTAQQTITLELPWPPSLNHYFAEHAMPPATARIQEQIRLHGMNGLHVWLRKNTRVMKRVGERGHMYRADVLEYVLKNRLNKGLRGPLKLTGLFYPPTRRKADLDNYDGKALLDAMELAGVFLDDNQIKARDTIMCDEVVRGGRVIVTLDRWPQEPETAA